MAKYWQSGSDSHHTAHSPPHANFQVTASLHNGGDMGSNPGIATLEMVLLAWNASVVVWQGHRMCVYC